MFNKIIDWIDKNYNIILGILNVLAGFGFVVIPEVVPDWLIVFIGITWVIQGIIRIGEDYYNKY